MSEQNVEKIRASLKAWSRGDWDTALKDAAPDFVVDNSTATHTGTHLPSLAFRVPRRGAGVVERGGLENRWPS